MITRASAKTIVTAILSLATTAVLAQASSTNWMQDYVRLRVMERNLKTAPPSTTAAGRKDMMVFMEPRIVGGSVAGAADNPFQVGLLNKAQSSNSAAQFCGGTLIADKFVVTAAHCSDFVSADQVQVLTGTRRLDGSGTRHDVTRITIHPGWKSDTFDNDVSVWELATKATGEPVATLASNDGAVGDNLLTTGWGRLSEGGTSPVDLHRVEVPLVDRANCNDGNSYNGQITDQMICAGYDEGGRDSCQGDSGGPLTAGAHSSVLTGITSWGTGCARPNLFGIYTRVSQQGIREFILSTVDTGPSQSGHEAETDRPGSDYKNFDLAQADPGLCQTSCGSEASCKAWTYVKPGVQGTQARCWLKSRVPPATADACCISGVKGVEYNTDRKGLDYRNFDLTRADPALCQTRCGREARCKAWTYVKPGVQGPKARCWLKSRVPAPLPSLCCASGVKR